MVELEESQIRDMLATIDPNLGNLYDSFDDNEKLWARRIVQEVARTGKSQSLEFLTAMDYERVPVHISQFLDDGYYLGDVDVWERWRSEVEIICDPAQQINEVILGGGIGLGKTFNAVVMLMYKLYELSCLRSPAEYHGLSKNSPIVFGIYNATLKLTDVGVDTLQGLLDSSPYFKENFWFKEQYSDFQFPKNIKVMVGSQAFHVLGHNLYCLLIDEMNFHAETKKQSQAKTLQEKGKIHDLVTQTSRRMESRFKMHGRGAGLILHISSTRTSTSYLELRKREVMGAPGVRIVEGAQWEFHPQEKYCGKKFRFLVGNKFIPPVCIDRVKDHGYGNYEVTLGTGQAPRGIRIIEVPVEDFRAFDEDPIGATRDIAGIPTESIDPFFPRAQPVIEAATPTLIHPFINDLGSKPGNPVVIDIELEDRIQDFIDRDTFLTVRSSRSVPRSGPHSPRYIHCDLARNNDALGLAMVHPTKAVTRFVVQENGEYERRIELTLAVDFAIQIKPKDTEIDWSKIREFILWLIDRGFNVQNISYDSPASGGELQYFKKLSIPNQYLSVDRKPTRTGKTPPQMPYYVMKTLLNEGRLRWPHNDILHEELLALEKNQDTDQVDHPPGGSKDVADAVCGAVYLCMLDDKVGTLITPVEADTLTHQESTLDKVQRLMAERHGETVSG